MVSFGAGSIFATGLHRLLLPNPESVSRHPSGAKDCCLSPQDSSTQIPKFGIVLVVVLVLGAWDSVTAKSAMSCN
jgi:hypothetical protein